MACQGCAERREKLMEFLGLGRHRRPGVQRVSDVDANAAEAEAIGPPQARFLMRKFIEAADGAPVNMMIFAAVNIIVVALSHGCKNRECAETNCNEVSDMIKGALLSRFDEETGQLREIVPVRAGAMPT